VWGAEIFRMGLWVALPLVALLLFVNLMLGVIARVAPQLNIFAIGFPITVSVGLLGLMATLPLMQTPLAAVLDRMLGAFN
jgi:flagellar biosynthetic protein FliR